MALAEKSSGTRTATVGTEHTELDTADTGVYVFRVDLVNMTTASGTADEVELRVYTEVPSGGTQRLEFVRTYFATQEEKIACSVPIVAMGGAKFTIKQTAGTSRNFPWQVITLST